MSTVRFGVVGTNFITDWVIASAKKDPRFELAAACSRTRERGEEFAARYSIPHVFTSVEKMAAADMVDAVYIASPNYAHAKQSIICMRHGKHVLCEKAIASNAREAEEMIAASEQYGVILMEGMMPTHLPAFRAISNHISTIGKVRRYFSSFCQYSSRYDRFKNGEMVNAFNPQLSNSAVMDIGIYTIYPMVVLFGRPHKVFATGQKLSTGVDGQGTVVFSYEDFDAVVMYSKIADSLLPTEIEGEKGIITVRSIPKIQKVELSLRSGGGPGGKDVVHTNEDITPEQPYDGYYYEIQHFINLIEEGRRESPINSHYNSLVTMQLLDEIRKQIGVHFPADL